MPTRVKAILQYTLILGITVLLIWVSLNSLSAGDGIDKWGYLIQTWNQADKGWLLVMAVIAIASHLIRAERWKMLIQPTGYTTTLKKSFLSVMVGYLVNLVIPRGGEISRCYNLYKLDKIPVDISFGTVVIERIIDLLCLLLLLVLAFFLESEKLIKFIELIPMDYSGLQLIIFIGLGGIILLVVLYWIIQRTRKLKAFIITTWIGIKKGLLAVFGLKNKSLFAVYSILIWFLYFLMSYTVVLAFESTANLGFSAVITLFGIGSIAMAAPLPAGLGSYHTLVPAGLALLYNIPHNEAVAFTFIFHGWQTLIMIVGGALSFVLTSVLVKKNSRRTAESGTEHV